MPKTRALSRRRRSIQSIRKITRTMELISTARFRQAMMQASAAAAYGRAVTALVTRLVRTGLTASHPLLQRRPNPHRTTLLVLTANRGLCAGYNTSVLRLAFAALKKLRRTVFEVHTEVSGERGIAAFRFHKLAVDEPFTHFEGCPRPEEVNLLAERYMGSFLAGEIDRLDVIYTKCESISRQQAVVETLLPWAGPSETGGDSDDRARFVPRPTVVPYEFLPSAQAILDEIVPAGFRARLMRCFLEASLSEQIARMVAMKGATDNADTMVAELTTAHNRARQTQITSELVEIIGGAEALKH